MAIGNQASQGGLNASLSGMALQLRNDCHTIANYQEFVVGLGLTGLEALGFTPADAQALLNQASVLNTIAGIYFGTATQATTFNFDNALSPLWAGQ